jgi:outer membrane biosynthesis protein TonB
VTKKQERHITASVGTALFMLLVFLILWFGYMRAVAPEEDEGVEIEFAQIGVVVPDAPIMPSASSSASAEEEITAPSESSSQQNQMSAEPIISEEETLAMQREKAKRDSIADIEKKKKEEELARQKEREKKEAERKAKEDKARSNAAAMAAVLNKSGIATGNESGVGGGGSDNPVKGGGADGGGDRDTRISGLGRRAPRDGKLPEPTCEFDHYGVVVVQIKIDKDGNNIYAVNASGTNTADNQMIQCAINTIKKVKWTAGDGEAIGTITYTFKVK